MEVALTLLTDEDDLINMNANEMQQTEDNMFDTALHEHRKSIRNTLR
jgi:hypothetical protein